MVRTKYNTYVAIALYSQSSFVPLLLLQPLVLRKQHTTRAFHQLSPPPHQQQHRQYHSYSHHHRHCRAMTMTTTNHICGCSDSTLSPAPAAAITGRRLSTTTTMLSPAVVVINHETTTPTTASSTAATTASAATTKVPKNTFYRRSLPDTCVAFSSPQGRTYFGSAMRHGGLKSYFHLIEQYTTQSEPAFCGISTLVIALNALAVDPRQIWKGSWRWYEESMLNCCIDLEQAKETGITMPMFNCLALCQGLSTEVHYVDDRSGDARSLEHFRDMVKEACVERHDPERPDDDDMSVDRVLIASYTRRVLNQTGSGHFSPIAAYDQESDSVLIMDTARFKYGAHWVKLPLLYEAMQAIDPDTGRSRGYMMLIHPKDDDSAVATQHRLQHLPMAILLRSEMKQSDVRRQFKEFLVNLGKKPSYDDITTYFNNEGSIWEMVQPQLRPYDNDVAAKTMIDEVRSLVCAVLSSVRLSHESKGAPIDDSQHCRANHCRTIKLRTEEAIFIVYLACLDDKEREALVFDPKFQSMTTDQARFQLLAEAELVRYAIDTSDQVITTMQSTA